MIKGKYTLNGTKVFPIQDKEHFSTFNLGIETGLSRYVKEFHGVDSQNDN